METVINGVKVSGFWVEHPLGAITHAEPNAEIQWSCPVCKAPFNGPARKMLHAYQEHVFDAHFEYLDDCCGCCGSFHFHGFNGDCREDWERF